MGVAKVAKVKYVVWSSDMSHVALLSKHGKDFYVFANTVTVGSLQSISMEYCWSVIQLM
jgi:hypothetical protein